MEEREDEGRGCGWGKGGGVGVGKGCAEHCVLGGGVKALDVEKEMGL